MEGLEGLRAADQPSEFQVTSPIVGTVNLESASDVNGARWCPIRRRLGQGRRNVIPQRSNLLITTGFSLPGFDGILRGFRVSSRQVDASTASGYKFVSDGTPLWIASIPPDPNTRNLYTALPDGTMIAFTVANAATLAPLMNLTEADATAVITSIRSMPLGAIIDSTPAIMNAPSLDPPPDDDLPGVRRREQEPPQHGLGRNQSRRARSHRRPLGVEVWGFVPLNLLPKLRTLRDGQPVGNFNFFVDGSPKIADVKYGGDMAHAPDRRRGAGRHVLSDVRRHAGDQATVLGGANPDRDATLAQVLGYFANPTAIPLKWSFPRYSNFCSGVADVPGCDPAVVFDPAIGIYGDLKTSAPPIEKTVGQTWSDPAVGQVLSNAGPYTVLVGSGFFPYTRQQQANRGGVIAGTTFYVLNAEDGAVSGAARTSSATT